MTDATIPGRDDPTATERESPDDPNSAPDVDEPDLAEVDEPDVPDVEVDLADCRDVHECPRCGRPFRAERQRDLHLGEAHDDLAEQEAEAYEDAVEAEADELFFFHMKVVVGLGVLYSSTVLLYTAIVGLTG